MEKKPRTRTVPIVMDPDLEQAVLDAKNTLDTRARELLETFHHRVTVEREMNPDGDPARRVYDQDQETLAGLEADLQAAQKALEPHIREFSFQPLGYKAWKALKAKHPSKDKDYAFDVDSITPELLRHASVDPKLSAAEVDELLESEAWSEGEILLLVQTAVSVQS